MWPCVPLLRLWGWNVASDRDLHEAISVIRRYERMLNEAIGERDRLRAEVNRLQEKYENAPVYFMFKGVSYVSVRENGVARVTASPRPRS